MGLEALVEGYVKGQDQAMKKAKEAATKAADQWQRQFEVQQAKDKAAQQAIQNGLETERVRLEGEASKRLAEQAKEKARHDKATEEFNNLKTQDKLLVDLGKLDLNDRKQANDLREKAYALAIKRGFDEETSGLMADQHMADLRKSSIEKQSLISQLGGAMGQQPGAAPQGGVPGAVPAQPSGDPFMDMLKGRQYHGFNPPSERPDAMKGKSPKEMLDAELERAKTEQAQASAKRQEEIAKMMQENAAITKQSNAAKLLLTKDKVKELELKNDHAKKMEPLQLAKLKADIISTQAHATAALENAHVAQIREARLSAESALDHDPRSGTAQKDLLNQLGKARTTKLKLNEEIMKNVEKTALADLKIADANKKYDNVTAATVTGDRKALAAQLVDLTATYNEANQEYLDAAAAVQKYKIQQVTTPSGGKDKGANEANSRAIDQDKKKAEGAAKKAAFSMGPMFVPVPHGTPMPQLPGSATGNFRSAPHASKPKGKIEKKKTSAADLRKKYGL